jgi:succinate dehydrogenase / fumarate reductase cytochrome b subunit
MTPAQTAFLASLAAILLAVSAFAWLVVRRSAAATRDPRDGLLVRLRRPSGARLELHRGAFYAHRIAGLAIFGFLALHLVDVGLVAISPALYDEVHALYGTPALRVFEVALLAAILFHAFDGLRLILLDVADLGMRASERLLWAAVGLTVALTVPAAVVILGPVLP